MKRSGLIGTALTLAGVGAVLVVVGLTQLQAQGSTDWLSGGAVQSPPQEVASFSVPPWTPPVEPGSGDDRPVEAEATSDETVVPVRVRIPRIEVDAAVVDLGLNRDGTLEVPEEFELTGWYTGRSAPGEPGPSVVVGHVDSWTGPAVFFRLSELTEGDVVEVERSDGRVARFQVTRIVDVDKEDFPTEQVYGATQQPTLRLITCGGSFDPGTRSYEGNVIVFAEYLGNALPARSSSGPV